MMALTLLLFHQADSVQDIVRKYPHECLPLPSVQPEFVASFYEHVSLLFEAACAAKYPFSLFDQIHDVLCCVCPLALPQA